MLAQRTLAAGTVVVLHDIEVELLHPTAVQAELEAWVHEDRTRADQEIEALRARIVELEAERAPVLLTPKDAPISTTDGHAYVVDLRGMRES